MNGTTKMRLLTAKMKKIMNEPDDDVIELDAGKEDGGTRIQLKADGVKAQGLRLDQFLAANVPEFSRSRIQKLIDDGRILINEKPAKSGQKLKGGETIMIDVPAIEPLALEPEDIPLHIVYQDQYLAVVDKPTGMVTHPGAGVVSGTLVNALLHHMRGSLSGISGVARPGIVHRLDKDTSGLLVIAKDDQAHRSLAEQIRKKEARRIYIALVEGVLKQESGTIAKSIGRHPTKRKQMAVVEGGKQAASHFRVLQRFTKYTLVEVSLETGRTHQIRVHMASLGHPVVGDLVYNSKATGTEAARHKLGLSGHALHAFQLSFAHPISGLLLKFEAPIPGDLQALIDRL
jgi:23S rRNA pseudouridine1911/1915/1917 synthase